MSLPDSPFSLLDHVPKSIFARFSERPPSLESALWVTIQEYRDRLRGQYHPEGFSIGINDGRAAGQTIEHAHVHVIPRYEADAAEHALAYCRENSILVSVVDVTFPTL